jgi:hypothetical protein
MRRQNYKKTFEYAIENVIMKKYLQKTKNIFLLRNFILTLQPEFKYKQNKKLNIKENYDYRSIEGRRKH